MTIMRSRLRVNGTRVVGADDDTVRLHEVGERGAFLEKFRIRNDIELDVRAARLERAVDLRAHLVGSPDRDGRLRDHDAVLRDVASDRLGHGEHVFEISRAVLVGRRADRDELEQAVLDAFGRVGREVEAPGREVLLQQLIESRLIDRRLAALEHLDLPLVDVHAQDVVTDLGETSAGDQSHVTGAEDGETHM